MSKAVRSMFAIDIRYRIWDNVNSQWIVTGATRRELFIQRGPAETARQLLINKGRSPESLEIKRVFVQLAPGE